MKLSAKRKRALKSALIRITGGKLISIAAAIHNQPTPFPSKGPGRHLEVRPDDTFIVSYPRSGNTWLRFLVANLVHSPLVADYSNIERLVPDIYATPETHLRRMDGPRYLKSHEAFDARYQKVIYIVRDPRAVMVSQFTTLRRLRSDLVNGTFTEFVDRQLAGEFDAWFGSWSANVNSWIHQDKADVDLLLIRYEDAAADTFGVTASIARFLLLARSAGEIEAAIEKSSRAHMIELYKTSHEKLESSIGRVNAGYLRPTTDADRPTISSDIEERIRRRFGPLMAKLDYL